VVTGETETIYVCAGICRVDYRTSTCIGCGRPVVDASEVANPTPVGDQASAHDDANSNDERS